MNFFATGLVSDCRFRLWLCAWASGETHAWAQLGARRELVGSRMKHENKLPCGVVTVVCVSKVFTIEFDLPYNLRLGPRPPRDVGAKPAQRATEPTATRRATLHTRIHTRAKFHF